MKIRTTHFELLDRGKQLFGAVKRLVTLCLITALLAPNSSLAENPDLIQEIDPSKDTLKKEQRTSGRSSSNRGALVFSNAPAQALLCGLFR